MLFSIHFGVVKVSPCHQSSAGLLSHTYSLLILAECLCDELPSVLSKEECDGGKKAQN